MIEKERVLTEKYNNDDLTEFIKYGRAKRCMTSSELARLVGFDRSYVASMEKGVNNVSDNFLIRCFKALNLSEKDLEEFLTCTKKSLEIEVMKEFNTESDILRQLIYYFRNKANLTKKQLAGRVGVHFSTLINIENKFSKSRLDIITNIFKCLNVEYEEFLKTKEDFLNHKILVHIPSIYKPTVYSTIIAYMKNENKIDSITLANLSSLSLLKLIQIESGKLDEPNKQDIDKIYKALRISEKDVSYILSKQEIIDQLSYANEDDWFDEYRDKDLVKFIKIKRIERGYSCPEMSELMGCNYDFLNVVENRSLPVNKNSLVKIMDFLNISHEEIAAYFSSDSKSLEELLLNDYYEDFEVIRNLIYYFRNKEDISRKDLGDKIGKTAITIEDIEECYSKSRIQTIARIFQELNVKCEDYEYTKKLFKDKKISSYIPPKCNTTVYSELIAHIKEEKGIDSIAFSNKCKIDLKTILKIENGKSKLPSKNTIQKIYDTFDVNYNYALKIYNSRKNK